MSEGELAFPFEVGDTVLVRVREHGDSGDILAKFEETCSEISERPGPQSPIARFQCDWGIMNTISLRSYEAEFEVLDHE